MLFYIKVPFLLKGALRSLSNPYFLLATGIGLTKWQALQNDYIEHVVAQVPFVVETYSFYYMKEIALIIDFQGMIMT